VLKSKRLVKLDALSNVSDIEQSQYLSCKSVTHRLGVTAFGKTNNGQKHDSHVQDTLEAFVHTITMICRLFRPPGLGFIAALP
jgi:hypothetical protein